MRVAIVLGVLAAAASAGAYPQFQFASGSVRCQACHFAPDGGGLLNAFGRSEAGDTISWGGDGAFLHGAWTPPDALALGGDLRLAGLGRTRDTDDPLLAAFPMQVDLYARAAAGPISLNVTGGLNGALRGEVDGLAAYLVSREHYVMYQSEPGQPYLRAGRFFPVLGLRSHDHTALVRRALDFYNLEEPYALGGGGGGAEWELHATVFAPNPFPSTSAGPRAYGGTVYYERFIGDVTALAGQARYAQTSDDKRALVGVVGKRWLSGPKLLLLGELDLQRQAIEGADANRIQVLGYAGVTRVMLPGVMIGVAVQHWDPDVMLGGSARDTAELDLQLFPWAHVELHLLGRVGLIGGRGTGSPDSLAMLQLHYYP